MRQYYGYKRGGKRKKTVVGKEAAIEEATNDMLKRLEKMNKAKGAKRSKASSAQKLPPNSQ